MDLAALGYSEKEYLVSGTANRYRIKDPLSTAEVVDSGHAYTTRILVRRPTDPAKFNGTVVVEWFNVSLNQDVDFIYAATRDYLIAQGYAWVGVSAQLVGANTLKAINASRYSTVTLAADNNDPAGGTLDEKGDVLSWDVFAQVGQMLKTPGAADPLAGLKIKHVIAAGESQSATRLTSYYNAIQPLYPDVYEGFIGYDQIGAVRSDLSAKVISITTEFGRDYFPTKYPTSLALVDTSNARYWELAGSSHVSLSEMDSYLNPQVQRDLVFGGASITNVIQGCTVEPIWSTVPNGDLITASLSGMQKWLTSGSVPATSPRIYANADGSIYRDADGRVGGGIRLAAYDAPIAKNMGVNTGGNPLDPLLCQLAGSHTNFTPAKLCEKYVSRSNYLTQVVAITRKAEQDGFLVAADANRTIQEASAVDFGTCN